MPQSPMSELSQMTWAGEEDSDIDCMATAANQMFQELLGDHPKVL